MAISIRALAAGDTTGFIKLQWRFYEGDPCWVPPLIMDRRKLLDTAKNPFYRHAAMQLFIAERDGKPAGRIAALTNENHNAVHGDSVGFFGFFECANDQAVADALFDAAAAWLRARGKTVMRGPMNPSVNDEIGLLIDGFDSPPVALMTYNPRYYPALLDGHGFAKAKDLYAYLVKDEIVMTPKLQRGQELVRARYGLAVRNMDFSRLTEEVAVVRDLYNRSWEKNWGAVAMTDAEFDFLAADLKQVMRGFEEFAFYIERAGEPVGFALCIPDINQLLITNRRGRLLPGVWKLLTGAKKISLVRILVLGILPEHRGKGIDSVLYYEVIKRGADRGIRRGEASWILEDNTMINRGMELLNAERYKTYRLYDLAL
jgi:GNAT superfamily N-acetyltransferase